MDEVSKLFYNETLDKDKESKKLFETSDVLKNIDKEEKMTRYKVPSINQFVNKQQSPSAPLFTNTKN